MRYLRIIIACVAMAVAAGMQARDTEISVSYGVSPAMDHMGVYHNHWSGVSGWGAVNFTIDHRFADPLWIGLCYTYSSADTDHAWENHGADLTYHALTVNIRYEWLRRSALTLYSHVGLGVVMSYYSPSWEDSYNATHMAFQISPVGVQYDFLPNVGAFAEAGYGTQGVAKVGLRIGF